MKNKLFYKVENKTEGYKLLLLFYNGTECSLSDVTHFIIEYIKSLNDKKCGFWVLNECLYANAPSSESLKILLSRIQKDLNIEENPSYFKNIFKKICKTDVLQITKY